MIGTLVFFGIWIGAIALMVKRREDNRETEDHHVVKRDFDEFRGERWPRITCSCGWKGEGVPMMGTWEAKLQAKNKMKLHVRTSKKKVDEQW